MELLDALRGDPDLPTYRIRFHAAEDADARAELAVSAVLTDEESAAIDAPPRTSRPGQLTRPLDRRRVAGDRARPAVRAADLALGFGRETQPFKVDVRKLKNLGLTLSLEVGYGSRPVASHLRGSV